MTIPICFIDTETTSPSYHPDDIGPHYYPRGCLARFGVTDRGRVHDMSEVAR